MLSDDFRHFHLHWWEKFDGWLTDFSESVQQWLEVPTMFGLTGGQLVIISLIGGIIGLSFVV